MARTRRSRIASGLPAPWKRPGKSCSVVSIPLRVAAPQHLADRTAEGVPDDDRVVDPEDVEQRGEIIGRVGDTEPRACVDATTVAPGVDLQINNNTLVLKLLKSNITNVQDPIWDLMMKNIYYLRRINLLELPIES